MKMSSRMNEPRTDEFTQFHLWRVVSFWRKNGFVSLLRFARYVLLKRLHFALWDHRFEPLEKVATRGFVYAEDLAPMNTSHSHQAGDYEPSQRLVVHWLLDGLKEDLSQYSFVDFGSGRGRVLLAAAEKPFLAVRGIELSGKLHEQAESNISNYPAERLHCPDVQSVCGDALEFPLPEGNCILYFYNPFGAELLCKVVRRALDTAQARQSRIIVIFYGSDYHKTLANVTRLKSRPLSFIARLKLSLLSPCSNQVYDLIID